MSPGLFEPIGLVALAIFQAEVVEDICIGVAQDKSLCRRGCMIYSFWWLIGKHEQW